MFFLYLLALIGIVGIVDVAVFKGRIGVAVSTKVRGWLARWKR